MWNPAERQDLRKFAFHLHGTFGKAGRAYFERGDWCETRLGNFADIAGKLDGTDIHLVFEIIVDQVRLVGQARDPETGVELNGYQKSIRVAEYLTDHQDRLRLSDDAVQWVSLIVKLAWAVAKLRKLL